MKEYCRKAVGIRNEYVRCKVHATKRECQKKGQKEHKKKHYWRNTNFEHLTEGFKIFYYHTY
jgi:hypothetical protein